MAVLDTFIFLLTVVGIAYIQVPVIVWTLLVGTVLVLLTLFGSLGLVSLSIFWLGYLAAAAFANLKKIRKKYFTIPFVNLLQRRMPPISDTEREAIEAGNVWWEKDLFCGRPNWKKFHSMPKPTLTQEEKSFLDNQVETLCSMLNDWQIVNQHRDLPKEVWDYLKNERFFGMVIPKEYGGHGFSALAHSTVVVKIATRSISTAVNTMVPNSLGPAELLLHYGTNEQKEYYLPRLANGQEIPCFALTGPEAGSDAGSITDTGVICRGQHNGKEVIGIRLNWDKRYITLAPVASVLGLAFRMYDPDHLLSEKTDIGITLCLVPTNHPGVQIGNRHLPLNLAFMNGPTKGKDVFIPLDWIIGGVEMAGQGWRMLMECLSIGRSISLPALSTACGKLSYRMTGAYARLRRQFTTSSANFEGVEAALGNIGGLTYTIEACRMLTAGAVDQNIKPAIASAIAKYHMTEMARKIISHSMDVHAGHAIQVGPRNLIAHAHFAIPVSITVEGANILTRNLIIFGQGAIRCHPYILKEIQLFSTPESSNKIEQLDKILLSHIGFFISNIARNICAGLTGGRIISSPYSGPMARYYRQLTRMSSALALLSDVSMLLLGGALKRKERLSARLGDILSQLYLASAVLKYYRDEGQPKSDLNYVKWSVENCLFEIQNACDELLNNFPMRWVGKVLRFVIFPFGRAYNKPSDNLYHQVVRSMLEPTEIRDRLTRYCYLGTDQNDTIPRMEEALSQLTHIEPLWKKLQNAVRSGTVPRLGTLEERTLAAQKSGVLTPEEARSICHFDSLHKEVIQVNEFTFDLETVVT
jgi:acyl-CoA dehydrogenase